MAAKDTTTNIALVAVFAAFIALCSIVPGIPIGAAPITLQTLAVSLAGLVLGPWRGMAAVALWLVVGFAGLPVFTGGKSGLAPLAGPTAGYLIGFLCGALVIGTIARWAVRRYSSPAVRLSLFIVAAGVVGLLVEHVFGVAGLVRNTKLTLAKAIALDLSFVPLDVVKAVVAAMIALAVHRAFPTLLGSRAVVLDDADDK